MNHFLLPYGSSADGEGSRYGIHAMELLINECMRHGADRRNLEAKVFGGGHVLKMGTSAIDVASSNIRFINEFLDVEAIPVLKRDVGGVAPREVYFYTDTGRVLLRRLHTSTTTVEEIVKEERSEAVVKPAAQSTSEFDDNVTLF
jgi:chemotaxis protein CheD